MEVLFTFFIIAYTLLTREKTGIHLMIAMVQYEVDIGIRNSNEPTANGTDANIMIGYSNTALVIM